jgi:hypothetical protein
MLTTLPERAVRHPDYRSDWDSYYNGDSQLSPSRAAEIVEELSRPDSRTG